MFERRGMIYSCHRLTVRDRTLAFPLGSLRLDLPHIIVTVILCYLTLVVLTYCTRELTPKLFRVRAEQPSLYTYVMKP